MSAIVVAVGRTTQDRVVAWAAREARACGVPLTVVHVLPAGSAGGAATDAAGRGRTAAAAAALAAPEVAVTVRALSGRSAADMLVGVAADAHGLVLGRRTVRSPRALGRVTTAVVENAAVPVTLVPTGDDAGAPAADGAGAGAPARPVVAGVDGARPAVAALRAAVEAAHRHDAPLEAVYAWQMTALAPLPGKEWGYTPPLDDYARYATELLDRALAEAGADLPGGRLVRSVVHARATDALVDASARAQRVVVGHRGLGGVDRVLLGSVSRYVLARARCPVTVVR